MRKLLFIIALAAIANATSVPLTDAVSTYIPNVDGDGFYCEIFLGKGGGYPSPSLIAGVTPNADLQSPTLNFPNPGDTVSISSSFASFFNNTVYAPDSVRALYPSGFLLRCTTYLKITKAMDKNPATPAIDISIRSGSDDGHYLVVGSQFLGNSPDHGFTWYAYNLEFEDEGLYPFYLLYSANNAGISGLEVQWDTALSGGWQVLPQQYAYLNIGEGQCEYKVYFDELADGTAVTNQYQSLGAVFEVVSGNIVATSANPLDFVPVSPSKVLADPAASPAEAGVIKINFVETGTALPATTNYFSTYVIDAETTGAQITAYDVDGDVLEEQTVINQGGASQYFVEIIQSGIYEVIISLGNSTDSVALDNICWSAPEAIALPDISLTNLSCSSVGWALKEIRVDFYVTNTGNSPLAAGSAIDFYLSDDMNFDPAADIFCSTITILGGLESGSYTSLTDQITLADNISGSKWLIAVADKDNLISEFPDNDNNIAVSASQILTGTDHIAPRVLFQKPTGLTMPRVDTVEIEFSEPLRDSYFTAEHLILTAPDNTVIPVTGVVNTSGNIWQISFQRQIQEGVYTLVILTDEVTLVTVDVAGNALDGNGDGTRGDAYVGTFEITTDPIQTSLFNWTKHGAAANGNWTVSSDGLSVFQSINGDPTFFVSDFELIDSRFEGTFKVETTSDDDMIGFVFAFNDNDNNPLTLDRPFYLLSWKKYQQDVAEQGFKLTKITSPASYDYWNGETTAYGTVLHTRLGTNTGWVSNVLYEFALSYQPGSGNIRVIIKQQSDGAELYNSGLITDASGLGSGRVGFYNYSQQSVRYAGFTSAALEPPVAVAGSGYTISAAIGQTILNASGSYDPDDSALGFGAIASVQWDVGNDGIADDTGRTNATETVTLAQALAKGLAIGTSVPVGLTVYDLDGQSGSTVTSITYTNTAPTADAGGDYGTVAYGGSVTLNGSVTDGDMDLGVGETLVYEWDNEAATSASEIGDGFSTQLSPTVNHTTLLALLNNQSGTIYLNVKDLSGQIASSSATISVEVPNMEISLPNIYSYAYSGKQSIARYTVTNSGACPVQGTWVDAVYMSSDNQVGGDILVGTHTYNFPVNIGQSYNGDVTFTIPAGEPEGTKWLVIKTNSTGSIAETTDSDNILVAGPVEIRHIPLVQDMADQTIVGHIPYLSGAPVLLDGTPPVTWAAVQIPDASVTVNSETGQVFWANPIPRLAPYTIKIAAQNDGGFDEESWLLTVVTTPQIQQPANYTAGSGVNFTSNAPSLIEATAVTWSLVSGPAGMTINTSTGAVSWPSPTKVNSPHTVTIKAENLAGNDTKSFEVIVMDTPVIAALTADSVEEWTSYQRNDITLTAGGDTLVVWSLIDRPAGMTIDPSTAQINWSSAIPSNNSYKVTVKAQNDAGYDTETFYLTVNASPVIAGINNEAISGSTPYSRTAALVRGAMPVEWALPQKPDGMTVNPATGVITWPSPVVSATPYIVTLTATNSIGSDSVEWNISVKDTPVIDAISDQTLNEGDSFSYSPTLLAGTSPISWVLVKGPQGLSVNNQTGQITWPTAVAGGPYEVVIQALNDVGSDDESFYIDVPILYRATVATDTVVAISGTPVTLNGNAWWISDNSPAANVNVLIRIMLKGMRRTVTVQTDGSGNFSYSWTPFDTEAGHYSVCADHPAVTADTVQDQFDLYGIRLNPIGMRHGIDTGEVEAGSVSVRNLGDQPLTGISYVINSSDSNFDIQVTGCPTALDGYGLGELKYTISGSLPTTAPYTPSISIFCDQGAQTELLFEIMIYEPLAVLTASPGTLEGAMVRGQMKYVEFELTNTGGSSTQQVNVVLPNTDFMTLVTPAVMPPIAPHEKATVTIKLEPAADADLSIKTGTIAINAGNAGLSIPYQFDCVSNATCDLLIEAVDDYTYQTAEAPKVFGADVVVKNPADGTILYQGVTDASGEIMFAGIPEAYYTVEVKAPNHGNFSTTILTSGGETTLISAFLPLNLVSYNWTVRPTQIEDHYVFTIQAVFETNVPAPVVTVEPALTDLAAMTSAEMQVNYTLTNHGLIRADNTDMIFDAGNSDYEFIPLVEQIGSIEAQTSIVVPVLIRDLNKVEPLTPEAKAKVAEKKLAPKEVNCTVNMRSFVGYTWKCGPDNRYHQVPFYFNFPVIECTGGSTVGGGEPYYGYGDGWGWGDGGWGGSGDGWYIPEIYIPTGTSHSFTTDGSCDPCMDKIAKNVLNCALSFLPLSCPVTIVKSTAECTIDCYSGTAFSCAKSCVGGIISSLEACAKDVIKKITPIGLAWNIAWCLWDIGTSCMGEEEAKALNEALSCGCGGPDINKMGEVTASLSKITGRDITLNDSTADYLLAEARAQSQMITDVFNMYTVILGSEIWFTGTDDETDNENLANWLDAFSLAMAPESPSAELIDLTEQQQLLAMALPSWVAISDAQFAIERWNNTMAYWQAGITEPDQIPAGQSTNFISFTAFKDSCQVAALALDAQMQDGFEYLLEGGYAVYNDIITELENPSSGVCARVKIEIKQEAVISRSAFEAVLELNNEGTVDPLENVKVIVKVVDSAGVDCTDLFGIHPPQLTGIDNVSGTGSLNASSSCSALWLIVPTQDAAPTVPVEYSVKGQLEYDLAGQHVLIPLYPAKITVMPNPNLIVHYFLEREVYSDDPFTPEIEPAVPFSLGLMMQNTGHGTADNVRITSSQPQIIENEKGLLINFEIIGTIVGTNTVSPSLTVDLGDIGPAQTAVAQWLMVCSLQGEFIDYSATFEHIDGLGNPRLSLVESVDIHEMEHVVTAVYPEDDGKPDFLVNDLYDPNDMPETLFNSDGQVYDVEGIDNAQADSIATASDLQVVVTAPQAPTGWAYIRMNNPVADSPKLVLASVVRSDGKQILITDNAWTTKKINHKQNGDEVEHFLHIFDHGGTGIYTVTYTLSDQVKPVVESVTVDDIIDPTNDALDIAVTYSDDLAMDVLSIDKDDLLITGPDNFQSPVRFIATDVPGDGTPRTGYYQLDAPAGGWTHNHSGTYSIVLVQREVRDSSYNYADNGVIGSFEVSISELGQPFMTLVASTRISRTVFEYEYSLTVDNQSDSNFINKLCRIKGLPASAVLIRDAVLFDMIPAQSATVGSVTIRFRLDLANPVDWNLIYFEYTDYRAGDMNGDLLVNAEDLNILAGMWLSSNDQADIYPAPYGDGIVNIADFALLAQNWLQ